MNMGDETKAAAGEPAGPPPGRRQRGASRRPPGERVVAVLTTCGGRDEAERIARALVERREAACVQLSAIDSVYRWQGAVQCDPEWRLLVKTTAGRVPAVERTVRALHGYALPVVASLAFEHVPPDVAAWVREACAGP